MRLDGFLASFVFDSDVVLISGFWKVLFTDVGNRLHTSFAFHPQSDGQSEAVNRVNGMYLDASMEIVLASGSNGFLGPNTATTPPITQCSRILP